MTVSIKQEDNLAYAYVYDYASEVKLDTVVIIWRADDVERADVVHDIVQKQMKWRCRRAANHSQAHLVIRQNGRLHFPGVHVKTVWTGSMR